MNSTSDQEQLQYTVSLKDAYWIPPNDHPLILRSSKSTTLKALLNNSTQAKGLGQYAQHSESGSSHDGSDMDEDNITPKKGEQVAKAQSNP